MSVARDGAEALDLLRGAGDLPDLVLLDLNMPRMSGHELLRAVKADAALRGIPVVVLSTSGEAADRAACRDADEHLRKPGSLDGLVALLRELDRRWLRLGGSA